jgi:hypothetical protein
MRISGSGGDAMTQLGTTSSVSAGRFSRWNLFGSSLPASGSSRTLFGSISDDEQTGLIAAVVYDGVHQTTPVGDSDVATGGTTASTTIAPGDGLTATLTTLAGDKVVGIISAITLGGVNAIVSVTGTGITVVTQDDMLLEHLIIVEVDAVGSSTTVAPTITFTSSTDAQFEMRTYVVQAAAGGGQAPRSMHQHRLRRA